MKNNFSDPNTPMIRNLFYVLYKLRVVAAFTFLFGGTSAFANPSFNPITSQGRLWLEWNLIPRTQWAPRSLDSQAKPNKSFYTLKLQPVFPFHLNKNWAVLTRTIFRFVHLKNKLGLTHLFIVLKSNRNFGPFLLDAFSVSGLY